MDGGLCSDDDGDNVDDDDCSGCDIGDGDSGDGVDGPAGSIDILRSSINSPNLIAPAPGSAPAPESVPALALVPAPALARSPAPEPEPEPVHFHSRGLLGLLFRCRKQRQIRVQYQKLIDETQQISSYTTAHIKSHSKAQIDRTADSSTKPQTDTYAETDAKSDAETDTQVLDQPDQSLPQQNDNDHHLHHHHQQHQEHHHHHQQQQQQHHQHQACHRRVIWGEVEQAAVTIQSQYRGYHGRKFAAAKQRECERKLAHELLDEIELEQLLVKKQEQELTVVTTTMPGHLSVVAIDSMRAAKAAITIQKRARGIQARTLINEWKIWQAQSVKHLQAKKRISNRQAWSTKQSAAE